MRLIEASGLSFDEIRKRFRWNVPARYNIGVDACDRHSGIGDRTALHFENAQGAERTFTFADLKRLSDRFANALAGLGIRRGDRIGIILPQRIETAVAHIAVYKLGAVAAAPLRAFRLRRTRVPARRQRRPRARHRRRRAAT